MAALEAQPAIGTIYCPSPTLVGGLNNSGLERWEYRFDSEDCMYQQAVSSAFDPETGNTAIGTAVDPNVPAGPTHIEHQQPHAPTTQQQEDIDPESTDD
jgi:hypothetical protein